MLRIVTEEDRSPLPAPWEQQPGESYQAFAAFVIYRDLGSERSLRAAYEQQKSNDRATKISGRWTAWSSRWRWVERTLAWDRELDRRRRKAQQKAIEDMNARHAAIAAACQQKLIQRLQSMDPEELSPSDMIRWFVETVKIERLALGLPTEISAVEQAIDAEIAHYRALLAGSMEEPQASAPQDGPRRSVA